MADFTPTQGRDLGFTHAYTQLHGVPPAEAEIAAALCVSPPSVNPMVKMLEKKGLLERRSGQPRSLRVLVPEDEIPSWNGRPRATPASLDKPRERVCVPAAAPANLYVLSVDLTGGPVSPKFAHKQIRRGIEICGDQTLDQLHRAIFKADDRRDEHLDQFQFGKGPFDPAGPNYGIPESPRPPKGSRDARTTALDDLGLKVASVFGYWFDFGEDWYHQVHVDRIERAIPTVAYPRVVKRVGKSPPQSADHE